MSWFGFGGGSDDKKNDKKNSYDFDTSSSFDTSLSSPSSSSPSSFGGYGSSSSSIGNSPTSSVDLQQELMQLQQSAMVQAVMFKLTEMAFEKCVTAPGSSLTSSEQSCINAVVKKYLDASEFTTGKLRDQH